MVATRSWTDLPQPAHGSSTSGTISNRYSKKSISIPFTQHNPLDHPRNSLPLPDLLVRSDNRIAEQEIAPAQICILFYEPIALSPKSPGLLSQPEKHREPMRDPQAKAQHKSDKAVRQIHRKTGEASLPAGKELFP
jgi:hypothetical protein